MLGSVWPLQTYERIPSQKGSRFENLKANESLLHKKMERHIAQSVERRTSEVEVRQTSGGAGSYVIDDEESDTLKKS